MKLVNVRIRYGGQVMCYGCGDVNPVLGDWVVVKNGELAYIGRVVTAPLIYLDKKDNGGAACLEQAPAADSSPNSGWGCRLKICGSRRMLRLASEADMARQAEHEMLEREASEYCLAKIRVQGLEMKLVAVEVLFDGSKTIFYYTADERVDFRLLVKELVSRFRTRIEMRQISVRHEARMVGGLGQCGRCFCCSGFLANFAPVSVKMAKEQNISLSPAKISGVCGRLMCCLAFEQCDSLPQEAAPDNRESDF